MNATIKPRLLASLEQQLGISLQSLLQVSDANNPSGPSLRSDPIFLALQTARSADDASLPMGAWQHELKRADWPGVSRMAIDALSHRSKDLQLAVWLMEAQMQLHGLAGIAPSLLVIAGLLDKFWADLHPQSQDGDCSHRANLLRWINRRLLPTLKLIPLTAGAGGRDYSFADLEYAQRREQHRGPSAREAELDDGETRPDNAGLSSALGSTPTPACHAAQQALDDALEALALLTATIDCHFEEDAPSLGQFQGVLEDMRDWIGAELRRRGHASGPLTATVTPLAVPPSSAALASDAAPDRGDASPPPNQREQAYALLANACETLRRIDPHSPVPYVVQRAIVWGSLNTAQLYEELFVRSGGQINIFDLLGIKPSTSAETTA